MIHEPQICEERGLLGSQMSTWKLDGLAAHDGSLPRRQVTGAVGCQLSWGCALMASLARWPWENQTTHVEAGFPSSQDPEEPDTRHGSANLKCKPYSITSTCLSSHSGVVNSSGSKVGIRLYLWMGQRHAHLAGEQVGQELWL